MICWRCVLLLLWLVPITIFAEQQIDLDPNVAEVYGPVRSDQQLGHIAIIVRGDKPWHSYRWMYGIYLLNQDAFYRNNMNNLKVGSILKIPSLQFLEQIDLEQAVRAVHQQKREWQIMMHEPQQERSDESLLIQAQLQRLNHENHIKTEEQEQLQSNVNELEQQVSSMIEQVLPPLTPPVASNTVTANTAGEAESVAMEKNKIAKPATTVATEPEPEGELIVQLLVITIVVIMVIGIALFVRRRREINIQGGYEQATRNGR